MIKAIQINAYLWYNLRISSEEAKELVTYLTDYSDVSIEAVLIEYIHRLPYKEAALSKHRQHVNEFLKPTKHNIMTSPNFFQDKVAEWQTMCLGPESLNDIQERAHRFLEEALEFGQSLGVSAEYMHNLVDYVNEGKPGWQQREAGQVLVTLAAVCNACNFSMVEVGVNEYHRINTPEIIERVRAKHNSRPEGSPLPGVHLCAEK